jgi:hypothetical protein
VTDAVIRATPDEGGIPFARLVQMARVSAEADLEAFKRTREETVLLGWMNHTTMGGKLEWNEFRAIFIPNRTRASKSYTVKEAYDLADKIREMDKRGEMQIMQIDLN